MAEQITIDLNSGSKSILKIGFLIRACFTLTLVIGSFFTCINFFKDSLVASGIFFIAGCLLFIVFFKLLNTIFFKESIIVTKQEIRIIHKNLSKIKEHTFKLSEINYFGFSNQQYTKHPLDNPVLDITGLAAREREMQYVIDDGNIKIETDTKSIRFGKNMPSWDIDELMERIEAFTEQQFIKPVPELFENNIFVDSEEVEVAEHSDANEQPAVEQADSEIETEVPQVVLKNYAYVCDEGELILKQKNEIPSSEDMAYLNGKLAPTGKYKIGEKQFVLVSNGLIYAVRGFDN